MTATLLPGHATVFTVEADTLHCTRPGCHGVAKIASHAAGERCATCEKLGVQKPGIYERRTHQVDVAAFRAVGECSCEIFQFGQEHPLFAPRTMRPFLSRLTPGQLDALPEEAREVQRCKHLRCAREAYGLPWNLDALILSLPDQHQKV